LASFRDFEKLKNNIYISLQKYFMGCTAAKQNKLEGKLSSSQNKTSHETLASPASLM
jgi:hypothetical protein